MCLVDLCYPLQIALQQGQKALCPKLAPRVYLMLARLSFFYSIPIQEDDMHRLMFGMLILFPTPLQMWYFHGLRFVYASFGLLSYFLVLPKKIPCKILVNSVRLFLSFTSLLFFHVPSVSFTYMTFVLCQKEVWKDRDRYPLFLHGFSGFLCSCNLSLFILKEATRAEGR